MKGQEKTICQKRNEEEKRGLERQKIKQKKENIFAVQRQREEEEEDIRNGTLKCLDPIQTLVSPSCGLAE